MTDFQIIIIIIGVGFAAFSCLTYLIFYLYCYIEELVLKKRLERYYDIFTWCFCKGDFVRSKECGGECETCKHFVTLEDLK